MRSGVETKPPLAHTLPKEPCPRTLRSSNCRGSAFSDPSFTWCVMLISLIGTSSCKHDSVIISDISLRWMSQSWDDDALLVSDGCVNNVASDLQNRTLTPLTPDLISSVSLCTRFSTGTSSEPGSVCAHYKTDHTANKSDLFQQQTRKQIQDFSGTKMQTRSRNHLRRVQRSRLGLVCPGLQNPNQEKLLISTNS